ncbi:uncharacterized protein LOC111281895 isoform X2 [Durio zibethinus]|uniref:Uncharacterized protein LOC111281895 isoform X2 n=1 Tax=Durio zibethinus TaxID=66656 RepID=A0A6P5XC73_DURZI|nr:uncharacterized protein LOC111281895 isoform X2 [Durio zibethinus]
MNFLLLRSNQQGTPEPPPVPEEEAESTYVSKSTTTLEGLIDEDPFLVYPTIGNHDGETNGFVEDLPDDWTHAPDIHSLRCLDRSFVFTGEQVHILACLSACNQETEIITPFKVAAVMSKNGMRKGAEKQNGNMEGETNLVPGEGKVSPNGTVMDRNGENLEKEKIDRAKDVSASESFLRMEDQRRQTETLLKRFKNSHFFVRIAESGEPLWSKKGSSRTASELSKMDGQQSNANKTKNTAKNIYSLSAVIDRGNFEANVSGGVARDTVKCCSLSNGDIMVLLQVNVGVDFLRDPVIEILQFEKYQDRILAENEDNLVYSNQDPCGELLKWLLPLDNTLPPPRTLSPPAPLGSSSGIGSTSQRSAFSASSGSQLFSFSHFRSYSMSSLPQKVATPPGPVKAQSSKPSFDLDEVDHYFSQKILKSQRAGIEELLSFRGVSLERERFSVCCGLEGIHIPGRRWRRKVEIIQPVEIHSYAVDCNTDDLFCVQIKNVSPAHIPDIVVYIDAITVVLEEASKGGPPASLPIACIEAGDDHCLPNLALRRGEEHSFILKPASSMWKDLKTYGEKSKSSSLQPASKTFDGKGSVSSVNQYAIMVSCHCNYTESRLFFKQPTSWRPRISRDLMISVSSEISGQYSGPNEIVTQLPVQVLTLQASNLTPEDLTITVLAPASFTSSPSVVSLNSSPTSPMIPFVGFSELAESERHGSAVHRLSSMPTVSENEKQNGDAGARFTSFNEQLTPIPDFIPTSGLGCTHLWLQSRVPLGCVPAQSTATIKLELLPLTDGIITLDSLQIHVKEKGLTYIPEHTLKINATSSVSTGII